MPTKQLTPASEPARRPAAKKEPATRKAVSVATDADLVLYDVPTSEQIIDAIKSGSKFYFDGDTDSGSITAQLLETAKSGEDLFAESSLAKIEDHLGETLTVLSIDGVRNSDFVGGLGIYLVVSMATQFGEVLRFAVGNESGIGTIVKLDELGELPWPVAFEMSSKPTKKGFYPINVVSRKQKDGSTF